jgi:mono/diheme cytochrome c family protein
MTSATRGLAAAALALACAFSMRLSPPVAAQGQASAPLPRIWQGAYTTAQAQRGKATFETSCSGCHGQNLAGGRGPALAGNAFRTKWNNEAVLRLLRLIAETMPRGDPGSLSEETVSDVVAYVLSENAFPAGGSELDASRLPDDLTIVPKEAVAATTVANFTHVQSVGCLTSGPDDTWVLRRASEVVPTKEETVSPAEVSAAQASQAGELSMRLVNAKRFKTKLQQGQRVYVKGLVNRTPRETLLNLTALEPAGGRCTP